MEVTIIDDLERYQLSAARRFFVVAEMRARAEGLNKPGLVAEMSEYLARLGAHLGEGRGRFAFLDVSSNGAGDEEGYMLLLLLIGRVLRECDEEEREAVLGPLMEQLTRLEAYARSGEVGSAIR